MPFKVVNTLTSAIVMKQGVKVQGFLVGCKPIVKKFGKEKRTNYIYTLQDDDGTKREVWGCGAINAAILERGNVSPVYAGALVRFTGGKKIKIRGRAMPMQSVIVECDTAKRIAGTPGRGAKGYRLNPQKTFKK